MRKITANVYMTLDGRGAFPEYPTSGPPSTEPNPLFRNMLYDRFDDVTTVVMGRRSFLGHQRTWSEKALEPGEAAWLLDYRRYLDRIDKVCLSHRLTSTDWENSRILSGDLAEILAKLKREKGGNIMLEGGPAVVRQCLRRNLADDYWFFVMPVVYGKGPRYWGPMDGQTTLSLVETKPGKNKEILLHYEAVRQDPPGGGELHPASGWPQPDGLPNLESEISNLVSGGSGALSTIEAARRSRR